jgi:hypothetical protein
MKMKPLRASFFLCVLCVFAVIFKGGIMRSKAFSLIVCLFIVSCLITLGAVAMPSNPRSDIHKATYIGATGGAAVAGHLGFGRLGLELILKRSAEGPSARNPEDPLLKTQDLIHLLESSDPTINLPQMQELPAIYSGPAAAVEALYQHEVVPLSLASGDLNGDGVEEVLTGYAAPTGGVVTIHWGNPRYRFPSGPEAVRQIMQGTFDEPPFLTPAQVFELPEPPDLIAVGRFNEYGWVDVVAGRAGSHQMYLLGGNGGGLEAAQAVMLPGPLMALKSSAPRRERLMVEIEGPDGIESLVWPELVDPSQLPPERQSTLDLKSPDSTANPSSILHPPSSILYPRSQAQWLPSRCRSTSMQRQTW